MFSFHKPKIYRSHLGCCICKAKSSSSRFTDSKKYEAEFERCFRITEKRSGEICNACVLLVKRWKKLPANTNRDWHHVVDARAGPGTKSIKTKSSNNSNSTTASSSSPLHNHHHHHGHGKKHKKPKKAKPSSHESSLLDEAMAGDDSMSESSNPNSRIPSPTASDSSDSEDDVVDEDEDMDEDFDDDERSKRKPRTRNTSNSSKKSNCKGSYSTSDDIKRNNKNNNSKTTATKISSFLDMSFWRKEKICCGIIFKGPDNEVLIDPKLLRPCYCRKNSTESLKTTTTNGSSDCGSVTSSVAEDDTNSNASGSNIYIL